MKTGIELIAQERQEQIEKHGYTVFEDSNRYDDCELVRAACAIAYDSPDSKCPVVILAPGWALEIREKKGDNNRIERLKVAGALIAAEIDRLQNTQNTQD